MCPQYAAQVILTLDTEHISGAKVPTDEAENHSALYGYLVDLFGEKLVLLLCARASYLPALTSRESTSASGTLPVPVAGKGTLNNDLLLRYLSQEGFRSTRPPPAVTQLRQRGPGRLFGGREPFRIAVRWSRVPLQGNVLEDAGSRGNGRGLGVAERGASRSLRRRSRVIETTVLGVSACWL